MEILRESVSMCGEIYEDVLILCAVDLKRILQTGASKHHLNLG